MVCRISDETANFSEHRYEYSVSAGVVSAHAAALSKTSSSSEQFTM